MTLTFSDELEGAGLLAFFLVCTLAMMVAFLRAIGPATRGGR